MSRVLHQVVNLRTSRAPVRFISEEQERAYNERLAAARAAIPRDVRYVVGPGQRVLGRDGSWREEGAVVAATDVADEPGAPAQGRAAWKVFEDLVATEVVIENYEWRPPADAQQHSG